VVPGPSLRDQHATLAEDIVNIQLRQFAAEKRHTRSIIQRTTSAVHKLISNSFWDSCHIHTIGWLSSSKRQSRRFTKIEKELQLVISHRWEKHRTITLRLVVFPLSIKAPITSSLLVAQSRKFPAKTSICKPRRRNIYCTCDGKSGGKPANGDVGFTIYLGRQWKLAKTM
jgi:hypothetical protein